MQSLFDNQLETLIVPAQDARARILEYARENSVSPLLVHGECLQVLRALPENLFDFAMTSPPYWGQRQYDNGGIGLEKEYTAFIENLLSVFAEVHRTLKDTGSFWLNIGDSYLNKRLLGIPWRVALAMVDQQGWILRNHVVWNKVKGGPDNTKDRLRNVHEDVFHFVKCARGYFYDADAIRSTPAKSKVVNGAVVSATGVRGVRYRRQIELSTVLTAEEKRAALQALEDVLEDVRNQRTADFRMIIRGQQRTTHSDSGRVSGRAREIEEKGFYFLKYHPKGTKPGDVWDILPEDTQKRKGHFAPYPVDLCRIPILATCPPDGIALDPFCGTGTTMAAAHHFRRKSVGIDISKAYLLAGMERGEALE